MKETVQQLPVVAGWLLQLLCRKVVKEAVTSISFPDLGCRCSLLTRQALFGSLLLFWKPASWWRYLYETFGRVCVFVCLERALALAEERNKRKVARTSFED